jgi:hypothetical protein
MAVEVVSDWRRSLTLPPESSFTIVFYAFAITVLPARCGYKRNQFVEWPGTINFMSRFALCCALLAYDAKILYCRANVKLPFLLFLICLNRICFTVEINLNKMTKFNCLQSWRYPYSRKKN